MTFPFVQENMTSRQRLEARLITLSAADLARSTSAGWTIAALLAHLAFWDQRALALLQRWKAVGVDESPVDADAMNEAIKPLCHALEAQKAVELCLAAAAAVDGELEGISAELVAQIQASPNHFRFSRALHRNDHLQEIEQMIETK